MKEIKLVDRNGNEKELVKKDSFLLNAKRADKLVLLKDGISVVSKTVSALAKRGYDTSNIDLNDETIFISSGEYSKISNLKKYGVENVSFLEDNKKKIKDKIKERKKKNGDKYYYLDNNDIISYICKKCGKKVSIKKLNYEEERELCKKCKIEETSLNEYGVKSILSKEEIRNLANIKYNVENISQSDEIKLKKKNTYLKNYGVENYSKTNEYKERIKRTNLEKYGVEYYTQTDEYKKKTLQTNLEKYGVEHYSKTEESKERIKRTNLEKYGVEYYTQTDEYKKKTLQTNLEKYGVDSPRKLKEIKDKIKETNLERYGVEFPLQNDTFLEKFKETHAKNYFNKLKFHTFWDLIPLFDLYNYNGIHYLNEYPFQCKICGTVFQDDIYAGKKPKCPTCFPYVHNRSKGEIELASFLKQHIDIIENDRELIKPKEIDILIPSLNLAIEYNGEYWHTDIERELIKKELVEDKGYDLIIIWESEWNENKEEIKEDLINMLI